MVIADDMLDTDELWVWDNGRGQTGLAVVRDGNMKISWSCPVDLSTRQKTQNKTE
jgi:hypothetical protein